MQAIPRIRNGVPRADVGALGEEPRRDHETRSVAEVVGVRLEREPENGDRLAAKPAEVLLELRDHSPLLELVHLDHGCEELEVVAGVSSELLQRRDVLAEAASTPADPGAEEVRTEPMIEPDALGDALNVRPDELADVRDLVDEADSRGQERVGRELDHLRGGDVRPNDRCVDAGVEGLDRGGVLALESADDDSVRIHEVTHGGAFGQELGVRHVADVRETAGIERRTHLLSGPDGNRRLHHEQLAPFGARKVVERRPHVGEIRVTRVGGRRLDTDEERVRVRELAGVQRVPDAIGVA